MFVCVTTMGLITIVATLYTIIYIYKMNSSCSVDSQNILQDEQDVNGSKPTTEEEEEEKVQIKESTKEPEKDDENEQEQSDSESVSSALKSDVKQTVKTKLLPEQETMPTDTKK